jgi:hypothetical protein
VGAQVLEGVGIDEAEATQICRRSLPDLDDLVTPAADG